MAMSEQAVAYINDSIERFLDTNEEFIETVAEEQGIEFDEYDGEVEDFYVTVIEPAIEKIRKELKKRA